MVERTLQHSRACAKAQLSTCARTIWTSPQESCQLQKLFPPSFSLSLSSSQSPSHPSLSTSMPPPHTVEGTLDKLRSFYHMVRQRQARIPALASMRLGMPREYRYFPTHLKHFPPRLLAQHPVYWDLTLNLHTSTDARRITRFCMAFRYTLDRAREIDEFFESQPAVGRWQSPPTSTTLSNSSPVQRTRMSIRNIPSGATLTRATITPRNSEALRNPRSEVADTSLCQWRRKMLERRYIQHGLRIWEHLPGAFKLSREIVDRGWEHLPGGFILHDEIVDVHDNRYLVKFPTTKAMLDVAAAQHGIATEDEINQSAFYRGGLQLQAHDAALILSFAIAIGPRIAEVDTPADIVRLARTFKPLKKGNSKTSWNALRAKWKTADQVSTCWSFASRSPLT